MVSIFWILLSIERRRTGRGHIIKHKEQTSTTPSSQSVKQSSQGHSKILDPADDWERCNFRHLFGVSHHVHHIRKISRKFLYSLYSKITKRHAYHYYATHQNPLSSWRSWTAPQNKRTAIKLQSRWHHRIGFAMWFWSTSLKHTD